MSSSAYLKVDDWVEVRSKAEILATLDKSGCLDGLPFMPEMFNYCGQRLRVSKRAHKACDPPSGLTARKMLSAVILDEIRCDGEAHGGCQAACSIIWKEAWLKSASSDKIQQPVSRDCTESDVRAATLRARDEDGNAEPAYLCQATQLFDATQPLPWWDLRQYVEDYTSGNVRLSQLLAALLFTVYSTVAEAGIGFGTAMRWAYDRFQSLRGGAVYPLRRGKVPLGQTTPAATLGLAPGDIVKVKRLDQIVETINEKAHNRGMYFDAELVPFCGKTYKVVRRVEQIVDEKTGRMIKLKNSAIVLQGVTCEARYATCRRFCPKKVPLYWREIWLERAKV